MGWSRLSHAWLLLAALALVACAPARAPVLPAPETASLERPLPPAPRAGQRPFTVVSPQGNREDPWFWLRDDSRTDPDVIAYLEAENAYFEAWESRYSGLVDRLYDEIVGRIQQDDSSVPVYIRGFWYYTRFEEGKQYPIHARRKGSMDAPEEILLDGNAMAEGHAFFQIGDYGVSDDNRLLAWMEDTVGRRQFTLRVRDIEGGEILLDGIERVSSFAWAADNRHLFYVENHPVTLLSYRVLRHELGGDRPDVPVHEEADESFYTLVGRTRSRDFLYVLLISTEASEMRILEADTPAGEFRVFLPREREHLYFADHLPDRWIVRTNWQAPNFRLMSVPQGHESDRSRWVDVVPHDPGVFLEDVQVFDSFMAIGERSEGLARVRILPWSGEPFHVPVDEEASTTWLGLNPNLDTPLLRYGYSSLITPDSVFEIDTATGKRTLLKRDPVLGGFDPANYRSERLWVTARDGERIPVSIFFRKDFQRDGTAPLFQYGYGAYGINLDPEFDSRRLSLADRGFVVAVAHVRGGQELGRHWYDDGRLLNKINTFNDFIDVTSYLVAQRYADPQRVFAAGGSAGGLLIGAVANMAPELYTGLIAHVPFVDVVNTMLDESIPLTTNEFDEWGNPKLQPWYDYMLSYSPYDNVVAQDYPAMLVTTGFHDSQVQYWEPAKWVARLRETRTNDTPLVFRVTMEAGHGGRSGRFDRLRQVAQEYGFMLYLAGIDE